MNMTPGSRASSERASRGIVARTTAVRPNKYDMFVPPSARATRSVSANGDRSNVAISTAIWLAGGEVAREDRVLVASGLPTDSEKPPAVGSIHPGTWPGVGRFASGIAD